MNNYFNLGRGSEVVIYGAGALGIRIYKKIKDYFRVRAFLDRREVRLGKGYPPVLSKDDIDEVRGIPVIICVHNGDWHREIAEKLKAEGFDKILFYANSSDFNLSYAMKMNEKFARFMENEYELYEIPCFGQLSRERMQTAIIRETDEYIVAWCDVELLYSLPEKQEEEAHNRKNISEELLKWIECPIFVYEPYRELFEYFMTGEGSPDLYVTLLKSLNNSFQMSEHDFLIEQWNVYRFLEREYENAISLLQYQPLDVSWNKKGYFNVIDGNHRAMFFYLKGRKKIPVRMPKADYYKWLNINAVENVFSAISEVRPCTKIPHPYFENVDIMKKESEETTMEIIQRYIWKKSGVYLSIMEFSGYDGSFSRNIYKMKKAIKIAVLEKDIRRYDLVKALNALQYIAEDDISVKNGLLEEVESEEFQCAIIAGEWGVDELKRNIEIIDKIITSELIWQSNECAETEKKYILHNTKFKEYTKLGQVCLNGKKREIGVFYYGGEM